jgi:TRAP-type C4-dicarboxylate transport system permease small subunit
MLQRLGGLPRTVLAILMIAAIVNLLVGVFLRYVMIPATDYFDLNSVGFFWVEELGELLLAWMTLLGAAIGVRERSHFTLHLLEHQIAPAVRVVIVRFNYLLITAFGALAAWFGVQLCLLNRTLTSPGLQINLAWLYASVVVGGAMIAIFGITMLVSAPRNSGAGH